MPEISTPTQLSTKKPPPPGAKKAPKKAKKPSPATNEPDRELTPTEEAEREEAILRLEAATGTEKLPKPLARKLTEQQLYEYMASIPADIWESRLVAYVYRHWPVIDRSLVGITTSNIDKRSEPITAEYMLRTHGSGNYSIRITDQAIKNREFVRADIKIQDTEYPPVLDYRELDLGHPQNQSYVQNLRARGLLKEGNNMPADGTQALAGIAQSLLNDRRNNGGPQADAAKATVDIMKTASEASIEMLMKQMGNNNGNAEMMRLLSDLIKNRGNDPMMPLIFQMMMKQQEQSTTLLTTLLPLLLKNNQTPHPPSKIGELKEVLELANMLKGDGANSGGWAEKLVEALPVVADRAAHIFTAGRGNGAQMNEGATQMGQLPQDDTERMARDLDRYMNFVIQAINRGSTGQEFAADIENLLGYGQYIAIAQHGPEKLMAAFRKTQAWPQLAPIESTFASWVNDFCQWQHDRMKEEGAEATA